MRITTAQALAWRLRRHHLRAAAATAVDVVRRLVAVPAWLGDADLAIRSRMDPGTASGAVDRALDAGELLRTFAWRGSTQLLAAEDAGTYLAVRCANRQWELASWQKHYDLKPDDWPGLRETVRGVLADGPVSHPDFVAAVTAQRRFRHLRAALTDPSQTLLKPLAWQGDLCLGPPVGGTPSFASPAASPAWTGLPELDDAGRRSVLAYLAGYAPATHENVQYWLVAGLSAGKRNLQRWLDELVGGPVVEIDVDSRPMLALREHVQELAESAPDDDVTLLPGHDQWVLGPGTADESIVPPELRPDVTRGANLVVDGGVVRGTWKLTGDQLVVTGAAPAGAEIARLGCLLGRDLSVA